MSIEKLDPVSGRRTTGHEWNGIEELDTPVPRVVIFFLAATFLFSAGYWILMPAWPTLGGYTAGLLGIDQREVVARQVRDAARERGAWMDRIETAGFAEIAADPALMAHVRDSGRTLFADNCAVCHGVEGTGGPGYPNLAAGAWLWGGEPEAIAETIRVGVNSTVEGTRVSQMLAFGRDGILDAAQVRAAAAYVRSLSGQPLSAEERGLRRAGREIYAANCAACHGADGTGGRQFGAPDLTDAVWLHGGDAQSVQDSIQLGRQGHMPHWSGRLSPAEIKLLALYVGTLRERGR